MIGHNNNPLSSMARVQRIVLWVILVFSLVSVMISTTAHVGAQACGADGAACAGGNPPCCTGLVCNFGPKICEGLSLSVSVSNPTASSVFLNPSFNSASIDRFSGCIGPQAQCDDRPYTDPLYWTTTLVGPFNLTLNGLRAMRAYTVTGEASENGSVALAQAPGVVVTWPGYPPTVTETNVTSTSAVLNWTTPFPGTTEVWYGKNLPLWTMEHQIVGDSVTGVDMTSNGTGWVVTYNNKVFKRSAGSVTQYGGVFFGTHLRSIDAFDDSNGWIVGDNAAIYRTQNGGGQWNPSTPPGGFTSDLKAVYAPTSTTAWAVGQDQKIIFFNGTWSVKYSTGVPGQPYNAVASVDNKVIIAVGANGYVARSTDGGASWNNAALAQAGGANLTAVSTLDGNTFWIGGSGGKLLRSMNGGSSWSTITSGTPLSIVALEQVSPDEMWVATNQTVGHSTDATSATPTFVPYTTELSATININIRGLSVVHGAELTAIGDDIVSGNGKLASYSHYTANSTIGDDVCPPTCGPVTTHKKTLINLESGVHIYYAAISSGSGVTTGSFGDFQLLNPDNIDPTIAFTNPDPAPPNPDFTNLANYPVTGTANDTPPGIVQAVTLKNNGVPVPGVSGTNNWSVSTPLVVGNNLLEATATDGGGNTAQATATLIYDNQAPVVTINVPPAAPAPGNTVNASPTPISGTASDASTGNVNIVSMRYVLNGTPSAMTVASPAVTINWSDSAGPLNIGANTLQVFATDAAGNEGSATVTFQYQEPTFVVTAAPATQTKNTGDVITYTVTLTPVNGFTGNVSLSAANTPGNSTTSFGPPHPVNLNGPPVTTPMTITTNALTTTGTFTITITGVSGAKTDSTTVQLILQAAPDFTISAAPDPQTIVAGQSTTYTVTVDANSTFSGIVTFQPLGGLHVTMTGSFNPGSLNLPLDGTGQSVLTVTTQMATPNGVYPLTITGTSGPLTRTHTITLNVSPPPDINLSVVPPNQLTTAGGPPVSFNGTAQAVNGFDALTALSVTHNPAHPDMVPTVSVTQITPGMWAGNPNQQFILSVTTTSAVPAGNYQLTVTADYINPITGNPDSKTATVTLQVGADTTPPVITNIQALPDWNNVRITWDTDEPANSQIILYTDAAQTQIISTVSDISTYCTATCHNMYYGPPGPALTALTTYYFSVTSVDQAPVPPPAGICPTAGNCATVSQSGGQPLQFTTLAEPDLIPPVIDSFDSPADGTTVSGTTSVSGQASDNIAVSQVLLTIKRLSDGVVVVNTNISCVGPVCSFNYVWNTITCGLIPPSLCNGLHEVTVQAQDTVNLSVPVTHTVTVFNDTDPPQVLNGPTILTGFAANSPTSLFCDPQTNLCQVTILWETNKLSSSEVDYGFTSGYGTLKKCDDADPGPITPCPASRTMHHVTLTGLNKNQLYHYKITSCNVSGFCTN